jgi:L-gulonolactone oxidase
MASQTWRNWARTQTARPVRIDRPRDLEGVVAAVRAAERDGLSVRPVGAGRCMTGLAVTDGAMLNLSALDRLRSVDVENRVVVVEAGIRLRRLWEELWRHGLAVSPQLMPDLQSLGGALATGEHGTGLRLGGIAAQVTAMEMVTADGEVVTCSADELPDLFAATRVGLGAFGVVTAVTLACVPAQDVVRHDVRIAPDAFLDDVDELLDRHDHVEFSWVPGQEGGVCTTVDRLTDGPAPAARPRWRSVLDDERAGGARRAAAWVGSGLSSAALPVRLPGRPRRRRPGVARPRTDRAHRALAPRPRPVERESEYALPRACFGAAFDEVREQFGAHQHPASSLRVRFGAAEDSWLAMSQGRETCYLSVVASRTQPYERLFTVLESVAARYDGRPHWGRLHALAAGTLRARYPRFDDAVAVRDSVDPQRRFANLHLERILGE